jgi:hypothetical protein
MVKLLGPNASQGRFKKSGRWIVLRKGQAEQWRFSSPPSRCEKPGISPHHGLKNALLRRLHPVTAAKTTRCQRHALCTSIGGSLVRELEVIMTTPNRTLLWILSLLVVVLLLAPLVGMFGMGGGMMMGGGWMFLTGLLWLVALIFVIAAVVVLLARGEVG